MQLCFSAQRILVLGLAIAAPHSTALACCGWYCIMALMGRCFTLDCSFLNTCAISFVCVGLYGIVLLVCSSAVCACLDLCDEFLDAEVRGGEE
jgi:hypothetical protein